MHGRGAVKKTVIGASSAAHTPAPVDITSSQASCVEALRSERLGAQHRTHGILGNTDVVGAPWSSNTLRYPPRPPGFTCLPPSSTAMPTFDTTDASPQKHEETGLPDAASDEASLQEHGLATPNKALSPTRSVTVWTKMDLVVLPIVTMMYFLSSLVRGDAPLVSRMPYQPSIGF